MDPDGNASKIASLVRLVGSKTKELGRLTQQQAVRARQQGQNISGDTKQIAAKIEKAAAGNKKILKHKGHTLKDGSTGKPHYQTEGVTGHVFWGGVGSGLVAIGAGMEYLSKGIEAVDFTTYIGSGDGYVDQAGNSLSKKELQNIYSGNSKSMNVKKNEKQKN